MAADSGPLSPSRYLNKVFGRACVQMAWTLFALGLPCATHAQQPAGAALGPVDAAYFGLVLNRNASTAAWPTVPFGSWRLWDAYVTWPYLEPRRGQWDFVALDRMVEEAEAHSVNPLLVLAHSPSWASARPKERSGYKPGFAAEPADIADWRNYVKQVGTRYKGRIREYQVWNEPSDKIHFSGSLEKMVELTCEAYKVLKSIDPAVKVVSPGSAGASYHLKYLDDFLKGGGARCIDVVAHHLYVPRFGPEAMVPIIREVRTIMQRNGLSNMPLWNTETGWWIANTDGTPDHDIVTRGGWRKLDADKEAGGVLQRAFLIARAEGVDRFYWYAWANNYGWGLSDAAGHPKPAAKYWNEISRAMNGRKVQRCSADGNDYACILSVPNAADVTIRWSDPSSLVRREGPAPSRPPESALPK